MSIVAIISKNGAESSEVAEHVAMKLGYQLVSLDDLIQSAVKDFDLPEKDFFKVVKKPAPWHNFSRRRNLKLVSWLEKKLCELMAKDRMVFTGYLGYPLFQKISHALTVFILPRSESEAGGKDDRRKALGAVVGKDIAEWFKKNYQADIEDPKLYDLTLNLSHMDVAEAADLVISTLKQKRFTPMTYSLNCMRDLELACQVKTALVDKLAEIAVKAYDGTVYVYLRPPLGIGGQKAARAVKEEVMRMPDVKYVEVFREWKLFESL